MTENDPNNPAPPPPTNDSTPPAPPSTPAAVASATDDTPTFSNGEHVTFREKKAVVRLYRGDGKYDVELVDEKAPTGEPAWFDNIDEAELELASD